MSDTTSIVVPKIGKVLINKTSDCVVEAITGLLYTRPDLIQLPFVAGTKVVVRRTLAANRIAIISGGGAGHEPAHAGLVAKGMLSAAVCGDVFASPSAVAVSAALSYLRVQGVEGALVVVKNYMGDRLAFGLAVEKVRAEGFNARVVIVADDVALGHNSRARGLAGTVLVHKIAGALAEDGANLDVITTAARIAAAGVATIGASLTTCNIPGQVSNDRLSSSDGFHCEIGLGIHNEPGSSRIQYLPTSSMLALEMVRRLAEARPDIFNQQLPRRRVILLINNLGGLSNLEVSIFTNSVINALVTNYDTRIEIAKLIVAPLMTSLDAKGVSITILVDAPLNGAPEGLDTLLKCLDAPTECPHWPLYTGPPIPRETSISSATLLTEVEEEDDSVYLLATPSLEARRVIASATLVSNALIDVTNQLNALDATAGDGDTGDTMARVGLALRNGAMEAGASQVVQAHGGRVPIPFLLTSLAKSVGAHAGGTCGVLFAIGLHAAAARMSEMLSSTSPPESLLLSLVSSQTLLVAGFEAGLEAISRLGGAVAGDRTFLDALLPALAAAQQHYDLSSSLLHKMAAAAQLGAQATSSMIPKAGRATYCPDATNGVEDAGAVAMAVLLKALATGWTAQ
jgi:dihydroxyacetone kinase